MTRRCIGAATDHAGASASRCLVACVSQPRTTRPLPAGGRRGPLSSEGPLRRFRDTADGTVRADITCGAPSSALQRPSSVVGGWRYTATERRRAKGPVLSDKRRALANRFDQRPVRIAAPQQYCAIVDRSQAPARSTVRTCTVMAILLWFRILVGGAVYLAYQRVSLRTATIAAGAVLAAYSLLGSGPLAWLARAVARLRRARGAEPRRRCASATSRGRSCERTAGCCRRCRTPSARRSKPARSGGTARCSRAARTGRSCCRAKAPQLSAEEQAFIDGPCEELCRMVDDWDITHRRADLPPQVWEFLKKKGFFAMIIPKKYGGLEFSAYAHSCVLVKLASRSATVLLDRRGAQLARSRRTAAALRHRGAEEPLPAAARARRGHSVLRADRAARRLGRRVDSRHGRRLPRHLRGPRSRSVCA